MPEVRISEIHYDNASDDTGEAVEISGPADMSLSGWKLVLYNGASTIRAPYGTINLTQLIPTTCGARGVVVVQTPGLQNGAPDGLALVDASNTVVEFLSYEGTFTAAGSASATNPAAGLTSTDILVSETGSSSELPGLSLQRNGADVWSGPTDNTFGACNDNIVTPPAVVASIKVEPTTATVVTGASTTFTATALDADGQAVSGVTLTWSSSSEAIATVNSAGVATGVGPGDAQITAEAPNRVMGAATLHVDVVPPPPDDGPIRISEIHYDNSGGDTGEAIEIEGPSGVSLAGWSVALYNGNPAQRNVYNTRTLSGVIPATCGSRGVVVLTYPANGIQNGGLNASEPDGIALVNAGGNVVEFLSYEGELTAVSGPAEGRKSTDIGFSQGGSSSGESLQRDADGWYGEEQASFGTCNIAPPPRVTVVGRTATGDPPLPVGFEDQLFATYRNRGKDTPIAITWSAETPGIASIEQNGLIRALSPGTAVFRATAADGTTATTSLPTRVAVASTIAQYANNTEFGAPTDNSPSDDFVVRRTQYTASYSKTRGIPNWVSYELEPTHFGNEDRCDCFTFDPILLAAGFAPYTTADYTGASEFHGYDIARGHLARSFDRTSASLDNATTFYFTNIIPQAAANNSGPWAALENHLGDLAGARNSGSNKEVYIITGATGSSGTVKNQGKITIPTMIWKIAVIMPRDQGLVNVHTYQDVEVVAVIMPNDPTVSSDWTTYKTTVDAVEALSGYNLLDLLPDQVEIAVESNTKPPIAVTNGPYNSIEGESVAMSGASSHDPDGDVLTYAWNFGNGSTASGVTVSHTYATGGVYAVTLEVTDVRGLKAVTTTKSTVLTRAQATQNVSPVVDQLVATGKLAAGNGNALTAKLEAAAAQFARGGLTPAINQLEAFLHQLDALVSSNRLSGTDANVLRASVTRVIRSASP